jgi:hypothetical protein
MRATDQPAHRAPRLLAPPVDVTHDPGRRIMGQELA